MLTVFNVIDCNAQSCVFSVRGVLEVHNDDDDDVQLSCTVAVLYSVLKCWVVKMNFDC